LVEVTPGLYVTGDKVSVSKVVLTLLKNGVKYSPPRTPIDIRAAPDQKGVTVEVMDRGPGLPAGNEARVFEKFYRGATAGSSRGVGLGLSLGRGFVGAQGGRREPPDRPGGGAGGRRGPPRQGRA